MAKKKNKQTDDIQSLLAEKQQIRQWLDRLDMAADKIPEAVRAKVRGDYQRRLDVIVEELKGFKDEMGTALAEQRKARQALAREEAAQAERLAEAELRHTVGEYDEGTWSDVKTDILEGLVKVREDLKKAEAEIKRLEEALATMADEGAKAADVGTEAELLEEPEAEEAAVVAGGEELTLPDIDEEDVAGLADDEISEPRSEQRDAFDELAFLRSVTEDESHGPQASRASGVHRLSSQDLVSPVEELEPGGEPMADSPDEARAKKQVGAEGVKPIDTGGKARPKQGTADKTVKCGECGAMNLPTEWYCERCGAELAAL